VANAIRAAQLQKRQALSLLVRRDGRTSYIALHLES
jgi:hypothetical protein